VLLFGDGATVTLIESTTAKRPLLAPVRFAAETNGTQSAALCNVNGKLRMNGRQVFQYSATAVPEQIKATLSAHRLKLEDIDLFLFHQGSKYIVDAVAKRLELPPSKVPTNLAHHGNTVSSTIPLLLEPLVHDARVRRILVCGFGVGLSTATAILERVPAAKRKN
jgi:3-oxoacyl-[acyl-carrier-protein] synthase-3